MSKTYQNHLSSANQCFEYSEPHPTRLAEHLMLFLGLLPLSQGGAEGPVGLSWSSVPWAPSSCRGAFDPCPGGAFRCSCQVGLETTDEAESLGQGSSCPRCPTLTGLPGHCYLQTQWLCFPVPEHLPFQSHLPGHTLFYFGIIQWYQYFTFFGRQKKKNGYVM